MPDQISDIDQKPKKGANKVVGLNSLPPLLAAQRDAIRAMMRDRAAVPGSPIPAAMALRVADWVMMMTAHRGVLRHRMSKGGQLWPDISYLRADIANSAEAIETLFVFAHEQVGEEFKSAIAIATADQVPHGPG